MMPKLIPSRGPAMVAVTMGLASLVHGEAEDLSLALKQATDERSRALADLDSVRKKIAGEKPKMAADFAKLELELGQKRRWLRIARTSQSDRDAEVRQLERDRATRRQDASYLAGLLKDHALRIDTLVAPGQPVLDLPEGLLASESTDAAESLEMRLQILDASVAQIEAVMGGSTRSGEAATTDGEVVEGTFAAAGPFSWFISSDGRIAGEAITTRNGELPRIHPAPAAAIAKLVKGEAAEVGVDVTGGKAIILSEVEGDLITWIRKGGLWIWPILFLAGLSICLGAIKSLVMLKIREPGEAWTNAILNALRTGDKAKAADIAKGAAHPVAEVMVKLIEISEQPSDQVEETLYEQLMGVQSKAGSLLPVIAVTAATSPLLGLLGTVSGMIATFNLITVFGSGDPKPLAGGISEALVTTLFGLIVAIPALILHSFLSRRAQGIVETTERLGLAFVNGLRTR